MKQIITRDDVGKAISDLVGQGKKPTLAAVHAALNNRGSMSTLVRLKAEIEAATQSVTDSPEGLKAFREVWALAVDEGRKREERVIVELREGLNVLALENERLEGMAVAAQNHAAELEQINSRGERELSLLKARFDEELKQAQTAVAESTAQAADALRKLAEAQAAHAAQVAALQADLTAAVRKAHDLELQLVRATARLESMGNQPANSESQTSKRRKDT
jgi:hypothetical protein